MKKRDIINAIIIAIVWAIYEFVMKAFYPIAINPVAVDQFKDSNSSFMQYQTASWIWDNLWIVPAIFTVVVLIPYINKLIKSLK